MTKNGIPFSSRLNGVGEYYFSRKLREIATKSYKGRGIINLGIGSPDMPPSPTVIEKLSLSASEPHAHMYQSYKGVPALRQAFSDWYRKYFRVQLDPESQVLPLIGSKEGIMHLSMAFLNKGDKVLVPNPGYPAYQAAAKLAGAEPIEYLLEEKLEWLPDLEALAANDLDNVKMMWINYPHMPTGARASGDYFKELVTFAKGKGIILVNDNPYSFILNDLPHSILEQAGRSDLVLELNSLSKSHNMAGWRIGLAAGNSYLLEQVLRFKSNMDSGMFLPVMNAAIEALGLNEDWYRQLNDHYRKRRKQAWKLLNLLGCSFSKEQSGMFVWAKIPQGWESGEKFTDALIEKAGIFVSPGFIFGAQGSEYIRVSLCNDLPVWKQVIDQVSEDKLTTDKTYIKTMT